MPPGNYKPVKSHYEKIIVACCFLSLFVNIGLNSTSFAVYQPYIVSMPDIGDAAGSIILSTRILVSAVATMLVNRFYDFLEGMVATAMLVNRWFKSGIGTAVGVASVGSGVAGFVIPVAATSIIEAHSLVAAFACEGVLSLVLAVVVFLFLRNRPSDLGLKPHESNIAKSGRGKEQAARIRRGVELSVRERWLVLAAMAMLGAFSMSAIAYLSVLFVSSGYDIRLAAVLLSVAGVCLTIAKFLVGEMFDRLGTPIASFMMFIVLVVGLVLACLSGCEVPAVAIGAAVCIGAGLSLGSVGLSVWSIELTSLELRVKSIKNCQVAYSLGGFAMNAIPGPLKELTGTYVTSYAIMLALVVATAFIILGMYRRVSARGQ